MTSTEALVLLHLGASNQTDYPTQATRLYHMRVDQARDVLAAAIEPSPVPEPPKPKAAKARKRRSTPV